MPADAKNDAFTDEVFNYWIPRLVADGVDANDIVGVRATVSDWAGWPEAWAKAGDAHQALASERLAAGHRITAGDAFVRASGQGLVGFLRGERMNVNAGTLAG